MPRWFRSSNPCACRLEWRPSRWLLAALVALPLLAAFSLIESNLPRIAAWPLAAGVLLVGAWRWRHEARRPKRELVLRRGMHGTQVRVDGVEVRDWRLQWRGPLAFASYRVEGRGSRRCERLSWWPDTLPAGKRRELRLAAAAPPVSREPGPMPQ